MYRTLNPQIKPIGMYVPDHNGVYNNNSEDCNSFISKDFNGYIPIFNLIEINKTEELKFVDGKNKNNEITTYDTGIAGRNFNETIRKNFKLDVSFNDLFVGPISIILNFTEHILTVIDRNEFRKTFIPIGNDRLAEFKGKVILLNIHSLNSPKMIYDKTGCSNYLEVLIEKFKHKTSSNLGEMKQVIEYANSIWNDKKLSSKFEKFNSLKVITLSEVNEKEFFKEKVDSLYLFNHQLILTLDSIVEAKEHPETSNSILSNKNIAHDIRKNSFTCYIVDNEDQIADRYINVAGTVKRINKFKDHNLVNGLYLITVDSDGKTINDFISSLNDLDSNNYVYKSIEEANIGADMRVQFKENSELNRIEAMNESLETKAFYEKKLKEEELKRKEKEIELENFRNETRIRLERIKEREERKTLKAKRRAEKHKNKEEKKSLNSKRYHDDYKFAMERRSNAFRAEYEENKYQRDTFVEGLKTTAAVAGVFATGLLLFNKFSSGK